MRRRGALGALAALLALSGTGYGINEAVQSGPPSTGSANVWVAANGNDTAPNCVRFPQPGGVANPDPSGATDCLTWNKAYKLAAAGETVSPKCGNYSPAQQITYDSTKGAAPVIFQTDTTCTTTVGNRTEGNFTPLTGIDVSGASNLDFEGSASTLQTGLLSVEADASVHVPTNVTVNGFAAEYSFFANFSGLTLNHGDFGNIYKLDFKNNACPDGTGAGNSTCPNQGAPYPGGGFYWCPNTATGGNGSAGPANTSTYNAAWDIGIKSTGGTNLTIKNSLLRNFTGPPGNLDPTTGCGVDTHIAGMYENGVLHGFNFTGNKCSGMVYACFENDFSVASNLACDGATFENNWFPTVSQSLLIKVGVGKVCQNVTVRNNSFQGGTPTIYYNSSSATPAGTWVNDFFYNNAVKGHFSCISYNGSPGTFNATSMAGWTWKYNYETTGADCPTATNDVINATDPYVDDANFDLRPGVGSGLLGAGDPANFPATDIDGNTRVSPPNIGAN